MEQIRLNAYHIMWLFVFFDLPVITKKERKAASGFRKNLMKDGFGMMQFSVYNRHCASKESADVHIKRVKGMIPEKGQVSILQVTDNPVTEYAKKKYGEKSMVCHWFMGVYAGHGEYELGIKNAKIREKACVCKGAPHCLWETKWMK